MTISFVYKVSWCMHAWACGSVQEYTEGVGGCAGNGQEEVDSEEDDFYFKTDDEEDD